LIGEIGRLSSGERKEGESEYSYSKFHNYYKAGAVPIFHIHRC
jgi:hypothetical protein